MLWNSLVGSILYYCVRKVEDKRPILGSVMCTLMVFLPLSGWLADVFFGRYKVIHVSLCVMWISILLNVLCAIATTYTDNHTSRIVTVVDYVLLFILILGFAGFQANLIQFGIDQLLDASSNEIKSFIVWYAWTFNLTYILMNVLTTCLSNSKNNHFIVEIIIAINLSLSLCLDCLFNNWFIKEPPTQNPIKLVLKVIRYAIKTKHLQHRSAFTYCEDKLPSRIDFGKYKYGGPFTTEQVEDVKTFLRIAVFIGIGSYVASTTWALNYPQQKLVINLQGWNDTTVSCYERTAVMSSDLLVVVCCVPLYEFVLYPLSHTCIPRNSIFKKLMVGVVLCFLRMTALLIMEALRQVDNKSSSAHCFFTDTYLVTNISYHLSIFIAILSGLSWIILFTAAIEFVCSQSPYAMKGLVLGLGYGAIGLYSLMHVLIMVAFTKLISWSNVPFSCGLWYFLLQIILIIAFMVVFTAIVKLVYKRRQREDVLPNEQTFAIQYYEKYATNSSSSSSSSEYSNSDSEVRD